MMTMIMGAASEVVMISGGWYPENGADDGDDDGEDGVGDYDSYNGFHGARGSRRAWLAPRWTF